MFDVGQLMQLAKALGSKGVDPRTSVDYAPNPVMPVPAPSPTMAAPMGWKPLASSPATQTAVAAPVATAPSQPGTLAQGSSGSSADSEHAALMGLLISQHMAKQQEYEANQLKMQSALDSISAINSQPTPPLPAMDPYGGISKDHALAAGLVTLLGSALGARPKHAQGALDNYIRMSQAISNNKFNNASNEYKSDVASRSAQRKSAQDVLEQIVKQGENIGDETGSLLKEMVGMANANMRAENSADTSTDKNATAREIARGKTPAGQFEDMYKSLTSIGVSRETAYDLATGRMQRELAGKDFINAKTTRLNTLLPVEWGAGIQKIQTAQSQQQLNLAKAHLTDVLSQLKPQELSEVMRYHSAQIADMEFDRSAKTYELDNGKGVGGGDSQEYTRAYRQKMVETEAMLEVAPKAISEMEAEVRRLEGPNKANSVINGPAIAEMKQKILNAKMDMEVSQKVLDKYKASAGSDGSAKPRQSFSDYMQGVSSNRSASDAQSMREAVVNSASSYIGTEYVFGGQSKKGIDCSGLVCKAFEEAGMPFAKDMTAEDQSKLGRAVTANDTLQKGDLVFYDNKGAGHATHVAIYAGNGMLIHAPHKGAKVKSVPFSSMTKNLIGVRRIIGEQSNDPTLGNIKNAKKAPAQTQTKAKPVQSKNTQKPAPKQNAPAAASKPKQPPATPAGPINPFAPRQSAPAPKPASRGKAPAPSDTSAADKAEKERRFKAFQAAQRKMREELINAAKTGKKQK